MSAWDSPEPKRADEPHRQTRIYGEHDLEFLIGLAVYVLALEIRKSERRTKEHLMALADTLAELQAEDTELAADVTALGGALTSNTAQIAALQQQIADLVAAGTATPDQLAALQTVADDLAATHAAAVALVPAPPA